MWEYLESYNTELVLQLAVSSILTIPLNYGSDDQKQSEVNLYNFSASGVY